jgi:hypothetical protein
MTPKSGNRFSDKIMRKQKTLRHGRATELVACSQSGEVKQRPMQAESLAPAAGRHEVFV